MPVLRFKIICLEQTPAESFARASGSVRTMRKVLRGHGIPDGGWSGPGPVIVGFSLIHG